MSLLQTFMAGLFGDPIAAGTAIGAAPFWGGYPYIVSLYLGGAVLCFVAVGAAASGRHRNRLVLLLAGRAH